MRAKYGDEAPKSYTSRRIHLLLAPFVWRDSSIAFSGVLCESNVIGVLDFGTLGHIRYSNIQINPLGKENLMRQNYTFSLQ